MLFANVLNADALLLPLTIANPVETTRILALMHMADSPLRGELGPQASFLLQEYGSIVASRILAAVLILWVVVPVTISYLLFRRQDASWWSSSFFITPNYFFLDIIYKTTEPAIPNVITAINKNNLLGIVSMGSISLLFAVSKIITSLIDSWYIFDPSNLTNMC